LPYNNWGDLEVVTKRRRATKHGQPITNNSRTGASMRGEEESNRRNDHAKNAEEGINPSVEWRGVRIGFEWHESEN
jgi:hypothetical protein